jgi:hypothetical protein
LQGRHRAGVERHPARIPRMAPKPHTSVEAVAEPSADYRQSMRTSHVDIIVALRHFSVTLLLPVVAILSELLRGRDAQLWRSTATSWRSTKSSASLEADDRPCRTSQPQSRTKMR